MLCHIVYKARPNPFVMYSIGIDKTLCTELDITIMSCWRVDLNIVISDTIVYVMYGARNNCCHIMHSVDIIGM